MHSFSATHKLHMLLLLEYALVFLLIDLYGAIKRSKNDDLKTIINEKTLALYSVVPYGLHMIRVCCSIRVSAYISSALIIMSVT